MKNCSAKAFAMCPDRAVCGSLNEAVYMEGSDCEKFNEAADKRPMTNADPIRAMSDKEVVWCRKCKSFDLIRRVCYCNIVTDNKCGGVDCTINFEENDFCPYGERINK